MKTKAAYTKLTQWEYWPTLAYYLPLIPFFIIRAIKAKHIAHYLATNPNIFYSGNGTESKHKTLSLVPKKYRPKGFLVSKTDDLALVLHKIKDNALEYPVIIKPDIGFRGYLVKKIKNETELKNYLENIKENLIVQKFIPHQKELGIFYHRLPGEEHGKITSITIKKFIVVTGNGKDTLKELIKNDKRAFLYLNIFKNIHKDMMDKVYDNEVKITLSEIGNHSKGTQFINGNHLISSKLERLINEICKQMDGFYYGRLDIKYKDFESLLQGEHFKILEVNGIIAEPTHIYDASTKNASYTNAVKTINKHWYIMDQIAVKNHKENGIEYPDVMPYLKNMIWLKSYSKKLRKLNKLEF